VRSSLISDGKWPIDHVLLICEKTAVTLEEDESFYKKALNLATLLVGRVHSSNFEISEHGALIQALTKLVDALVTPRGCDLDWDFHTLVQTGNVDQRIRVLRVLDKAKIPFKLHYFDNLGLEQRNEPMLLEVMAELNLVSDSLVDWFLSKPLLVTKGGWPMRNVVCICNILRASGSYEQASQLVEMVLTRLHSSSFEQEEGAETIEALVTLQAVLTHLPVMQFLETGSADQRMRVLAAAAEAGLVFGTLSLGKLAQCMLRENIPKISSQTLKETTTLCSDFKGGHCRYGTACQFAHGKHEIMLCKNWINGTCTLGKWCHYQHGEMESLLTRVLIEEVDQKTRGIDKFHWKR